MTIRKFKKSDTKSTALLIAHTHQKFCHKEGTKSAVENYVRQIHPQYNSLAELEKKFLRSDFIYLAEDKGKIIGVIRARKNRINNLFVAGSYHKKGIGRQLILKAEATMKKNNIKQIKIRASLYATPFYLKMGYKKTTGVRNFHGLKIQPMMKNI